MKMSKKKSKLECCFKINEFQQYFISKFKRYNQRCKSLTALKYDLIIIAVYLKENYNCCYIQS